MSNPLGSEAPYKSNYIDSNADYLVHEPVPYIIDEFDKTIM